MPEFLPLSRPLRLVLRIILLTILALVATGDPALAEAMSLGVRAGGK